MAPGANLKEGAPHVGAAGEAESQCQGWVARVSGAMKQDSNEDQKAEPKHRTKEQANQPKSLSVHVCVLRDSIK